METKTNKRYLNRFRKWFLLEKHVKECDCSYCKGTSSYKALHYGLNVPKDWKAWNSWYVIKLPFRLYFRWTNSWIKYFKK